MKHLTSEGIQVAGAIGTLIVTGVIGGLLIKLCKNYYDRMVDEYGKYLKKSWNLEERS